jgi:hypothetical protein
LASRFRIKCDFNHIGVRSFVLTGAPLTRVTATANGVGIFINGANAHVTLTDTVTSSNSVGATGSAIMVRNSTISNNAVGIP